jgi:hypothetical protein
MRVTSNSWDEPKVLFPSAVLEIRNVDTRLHDARKDKRPDEWDPPIVPCDCYGPGSGNDFDVITDAGVGRPKRVAEPPGVATLVEGDA